MKLHYLEKTPNPSQFYALFNTTGWNHKLDFSEQELKMAILNSWYVISVYEGEVLVGFGRVISDGIYQTFLGDLIVLPEFQGRGIGSEIMKMLISKCKESGIRWIQLTSAQGKHSFYERFGFQSRPLDAPGMQLYL